MSRHASLALRGFRPPIRSARLRPLATAADHTETQGDLRAGLPQSRRHGPSAPHRAGYAAASSPRAPRRRTRLCHYGGPCAGVRPAPRWARRDRGGSARRLGSVTIASRRMRPSIAGTREHVEAEGPLQELGPWAIRPSSRHVRHLASPPRMARVPPPRASASDASGACSPSRTPPTETVPSANPSLRPIHESLDYKQTKELNPIRMRPTPHEFFLYYDI